ADNMNVVQIIVDNTAPTAGTVSVPAYNSSTWILATITNGTDALSGVANTTLWSNRTTLSSGSCTGAQTITSVATSPGSPYNHSGLSTNYCYGYILTTTDFAGSSANSTQVYTKIDTTAPTAASVPSCPSGDSDGSYSVTWGSGSDTGSGVASNNLYVRAYSTLSGDSCSGAGSWTWVSSTTGAQAESGKAAGCHEYLIQTINNAALDTNTTTCITKVDSTAPTKGTVTGSSYSGSTSASLTITNGTDGNTSIASTTLLRANATLSGDSCGAYGANQTNATNPGSPHTQNGLTTAKCYKYWLNTTNAAGLSNISDEYVLKVDSTAPTGASLTTQTGYITGRTLAFTVNNGTDSETAVTTARLWYAFTALSGGSCGGYGSYTASAAALNATSYIVSGADNSCFKFHLQSINSAGLDANTTDTAEIKIDATPPATTITSPSESDTISSDYFHITGTASDAGSGVARVWVSYNGGSTWALSGETTAWDYDSPDGVVPKGSATILAMAEDNAGNNGSLSVNPDFETFASSVPDDGGNDSITSWTSISAGAFRGIVTDKVKGNYAMKFGNLATTAVAYPSYTDLGHSGASKTFYLGFYAKATSAIAVSSIGVYCNASGGGNYPFYLSSKSFTTSYSQFSGTRTVNASCDTGIRPILRAPAAGNASYDNIILLEGVNVTGSGRTPQADASNFTINGGSNVSNALSFAANLTVYDQDGGADLNCDGTIAKCNITCWSNDVSNEGGAYNWDLINATLVNITPASGNFINISANIQPHQYSYSGVWTCKAYFTDSANKINTTSRTANFSIAPGEPTTFGGCGFSGNPGAVNSSGSCSGGAVHTNATISSPVPQVLWIKASRLNWTTLPEPGTTFKIENLTFGVSVCPQAMKINSTWQKLSATPVERGTYPKPGNFSIYPCLSVPQNLPAGTYYANFSIRARLPTDPPPSD
ncbi:MAG: hypothetical protein V1820_06695, partial [archaeon]